MTIRKQVSWEAHVSQPPFLTCVKIATFLPIRSLPNSKHHKLRLRNTHTSSSSRRCPTQIPSWIIDVHIVQGRCSPCWWSLMTWLSCTKLRRLPWVRRSLSSKSSYLSRRGGSESSRRRISHFEYTNSQRSRGFQRRRIAGKWKRWKLG